MRKPIIIMQSVKHLDEFNAVIEAMLKIPFIKAYLDMHVLTNEKILKNECYEIQLDRKETRIYINTDYICA